MKKNVLCVIPARGGSKGIPNKNLRPLAGKPLISYAINAASCCKLIDRVVVSTDDERIMKVAKESGAETPFLRPADISLDTTPLNPVVSHAMKFYDSMGFKADVVISLQPTSPFTSEGTIARAIDKLTATGCDSVVSITEIKHGHPYRAKRLLEDGRLQNFCNEFDGDLFLNRQERPPAYTYTGALYLRNRHLVENWSGKDMGLGKDSRGILVDWKEAINIDDEIDFKFAELILKEKT